jgi:hypothetical protein
LPDFSSHKIPKLEKCTKLTQNVSNDHKIYQMVEKYFKWPENIPTLSNLRPSKIYPNWNFLFENKPSGNHGVDPILRLLNLQPQDNCS